MLNINKVLRPGAEKPLTHLKPRKIRSTMKKGTSKFKMDAKSKHTRIAGCFASRTEPFDFILEKDLYIFFSNQFFQIICVWLDKMFEIAYSFVSLAN